LHPYVHVIRSEIAAPAGPAVRDSFVVDGVVVGDVLTIPVLGEGGLVPQDLDLDPRRWIGGSFATPTVHPLPPGTRRNLRGAGIPGTLRRAAVHGAGCDRHP